MTRFAEDAVPRRRVRASGRVLAPGLLGQQLIDVPIGKPGGDRNGARHTSARLAPEAGSCAAAVITSRRLDEQDSFASRFRIADLSLIRTVARGDPAQPRVACALRRFARRSQPHWAGSVGIRERALGFRSDTQSLLSGDECKIVVQL